MTQRRAWLVAVLFSLASPASLVAQRSPEETLARAVILYEELQLERAVVLLRQVISPSAAGQVTGAQRVQAHQYLGAAFALLRQRDSAIVHFATALQRDPFLDLDERRFTETERRLLAESRNRVFAVGVRPAPDTAITPGSERVTWAVVTTQPATVRATLLPAGGENVIAAFATATSGSGVAEMHWDGLLSDSRIAPAGHYTARFIANRTGTAATDTVILAVDIRHQHAVLEDTLADFRPQELLVERRVASASRMHLAKGLGLAALTLAVPSVIGTGDLGASGSHTTVMAGGAIAAGVAGFVLWRRTPSIAVNVAANEQRRQARALHNLAVRRRNDEKLAALRLRILGAPEGGSAR